MIKNYGCRYCTDGHFLYLCMLKFAALGKRSDVVGVIGEMDAIGFQGRIGFIIVLMAPITLTSASADHSPAAEAGFFVEIYSFSVFYSYICPLYAHYAREGA